MSRSSVDSTVRTSPPGQHSRSGSGAGNQASSLAAEGSVTVSPTAKRHQRIVLADPVALVYLEEDPSTTLLHRRTILEGYEIYVVEQWACSRVHPTFIIATYTGDLSHHITVGVLSIPTDSSSWSPRLKLYFDAVQQYHAAAKETPLGTLMVTNLSAFPSALTVIAIPDGDVRKNRDLFVVNENLKRLGCAGRASLKLEEPSPVAKAKFYQLYKASEHVPLKIAVMELVRQCQLALTLFGKLAPEYADGLLCDVTEKAIVDWWADIGTDQYNVEPSDGILGATTVAALLGALMGARNRLHAVGAPVPKDVFDLSGMKRGISSFQKSQKLERTRRLDRDTLDRLYRVSQRATNSDRWAGAVKSTVAELSGKGGEMVMGMVGRDRGGISDIETLDLEQFTKLVHGERARWLWQGKPRKSTLSNGSESISRADDAASTADEQGSYVWTGRKRIVDTESGLERVTPEVDNTRRLHDPESVAEERDFNLGRIVSRSLTGKVSDARAGFGRFKDAVGIPSRRSHHNQHHSYSAQRIRQTDSIDLMTPGNAEEMDANADETDQTAIATEQEGLDLIEKKSIGEPRTKDHTGTAQEDQTLESSTLPSVQKVTPEIHVVPESPPVLQSDHHEELSISKQTDEENLAQESEGLAEDDKALELSKTRSMETPSEQDVSDSTLYRCLRRSQSFSDGKRLDSAFARNGRWPRHLSFSTVEEVVLVWEGFKTVPAKSDEAPAGSLEDEILHECVLMADTQAFGSGVLELSQQTIPWVEGQVGSVEILHRKVNALQEKWEYQYPEHLEHIEAIRERVTELFGDGGSRLTEDMKKIEMLGAKLDYELNVLESKIEDVEEGLRDFSRNVGVVEGRIRGLVQGEQKNHTSWFSWAGRKFGRF